MSSKLTLAAYFCLLISCTHMTQTPPDAIAKDKTLSMHGDTRIDPYFWLNNREDPEVIQYLNDENSFTKSVLEPSEKLQKNLFEEMKGRIKEDDSSVSSEQSQSAAMKAQYDYIEVFNTELAQADFEAGCAMRVEVKCGNILRLERPDCS